MKIKKNPKFNEDKNRVVYFQLGLFITSAAMLMAFSWKAPKVKHFNFNEERVAAIPEDSVYIEKIEYPEVKPMKKLEEPQIDDLTDEVKEVENKDEKKEMDLASTDFSDEIDDCPDCDGAPGVINEDIIVDFPDELAEFPGSFSKFLNDSLVYPEISRQFDEEGVIYVSFVVERDGKLKNFNILKGSHKSSDLRGEALRVIKQSPKWKPATKNGEKVRSVIKVPIRFSLSK